MADQLTTTDNSLRYYALGEKAVTVVFGDSIDPKISHKIRLAESVLKNHPFPGMLSIVAAYTTLCIHYDPFVIRSSVVIENKSIQAWVMDYLSQLMNSLRERADDRPEVVVIPVCYGGTYGPDLEEVAAHTGLSEEDVIALHTSNTYLVYMMGFMPGFPYLGGLDERLATPRKKMPRQLVVQGSVGIAGAQTGVYPLDSPGGWQLIGRTPLRLFDPTNEQPILLKSGQQVRFETLDHHHFEAYQRDSYGNKTS
ncbi:5-oxoprolinase subunit PxpB [Sphingobacterium sp. lm-10]|uniref:5-oxoprolinase subunit PxpB n=1 Tax=Sphingobacterium sp. lm-10 TaxID=2944904 RepID=UPI0020216C77|nr:5-oxoprolinase subunit PxpB [Sphingobacterium sp. lm-10]MCL7987529.1 5-oxoprolinase subunit PxpB [Sphingobacterium sp. lm-10]